MDHNDLEGMLSSEKSKVLIVDDDMDYRDMMSLKLRSAGYEVIQAHDSRSALEAAAQDPDLILMDLNLEVTKECGLNICLTLKGHPSYQHIPVVFMTGEHIDEVDQSQGYIVGASDYIQKNTPQSILLSKVGTFVSLRRREKELIQSENKYRAILEGIHEAVYQVDLEGNFTFFTPQMEAMLRYDPSTLAGMNFKQYMSPETAETVFAAFHQVFKTANTHTAIDWELIRADGSVCYVENSVSLVYDKDGKKIGFRGIVRDISERKESELQLQNSEDRYKTLIETMSEGMGMVNNEGIVLFANEALGRMLGYGSEIEERLTGILGRHITDFLDDKNRQIMEGHKGHGSYELEFLKQDGSKISTIVSPRQLYDPQHKKDGSFAVVTDITDLKVAHERLYMLTRRQAYQTMAGGIAHDFNNMLTAIMGNTELILMDITRSDNPDQGILDNLGEMRKAEAALAGLVARIKRLSKDSNSPKAVIDVYGPINDSVQLLRKEDSAVVVPELSCPPGRYYINVDGSEMGAAFLNVLMNSSDAIAEKGFTDESFIRIYVDKGLSNSAMVHLPPGEYVHVTIEDNGAGMSDEVRKMAFDPFFTTKKNFTKKGQGLGLAYVEGVIRADNGYVELESVLGQGTKFHAYLPLAEKPAPSVSRSGSGQSYTILVVEDEEQLRRMSAQIFERKGHTVLTAKDGLEGLEVYKANIATIDVVLLDLTMPRMSGNQVYVEIKKLNPDAKIVINSGYDMDDSGKAQFGDSPFIKKPFLPSQLYATIDSLFQAK